MEDICKFVGLEYSENMLNVPQVGSSTVADKSETKGIDSSRTSGYKRGGLNDAELKICESHVGHNMRYHGYQCDGYQASMMMLAWYWLTFPLKIGVALMLNLNRMKNVVESIKRRIK